PGNSCTIRWRTNFPLLQSDYGKAAISKGRRQVPLVTQAILPPSICRSTNSQSEALKSQTGLSPVTVLAPVFPQRNQKHHHADPCQNNRDGKPGGRDLAAVMIIFLECPSEAYQERKNANAEHNQSDRSLVIG